MATRSEDLASKVEASFNDLLAAVESSTPQQWAAPCTDVEWSQGFAAFHAATSMGEIAQTVKSVADGEPFPQMTMAELDGRNAEQAKLHADCTPEETAALIRRATPAAAGIVRSFSDAQLDRKVQLPDGMPEVSIEMLVQMAMVGHAVYHLQTITNAR